MILSAAVADYNLGLSIVKKYRARRAIRFNTGFRTYRWSGGRGKAGRCVKSFDGRTRQKRDASEDSGGDFHGLK